MSDESTSSQESQTLPVGTKRNVALRNLFLDPNNYRFIDQPDYVRVTSCMPSFSQLEHGKVKYEGDYSFGCWVFSSQDKELGVLEDALEPELNAHYEARWSEAESFFDKHSTGSTHPRSKRLKAIIAISGQPDHPGCSQAVVLREILKEESVLNRFKDVKWVKAFEQILTEIIA
jgi:hypothetical protein